LSTQELLQRFDAAVAKYIRPQTMPIGIKMVPAGEEPPAKARQPKRDYGYRYAICQATTAARKLGWTMAIGKEDLSCPPALSYFGFRPRESYLTEGNLGYKMYNESLEAASNYDNDDVLYFPEGKYDYFVVGPITRIDFDPDFVVVYGMPAQINRFIQARLWKDGGMMTSSFAGRGCAGWAVKTIETGECQIVLPGNGERVFAHTQDHEMAFTIPLAKLEEIMVGLEGTHKGQVRYPITTWVNYEGVFPPHYRKLEDYWE